MSGTQAPIDGWRLWPLALRYRVPIRWSDIVEEAAHFLVLELRAGGESGFAEVTVKPTWNGTTLRALAAVLEELFLPRLGGKDANDPSAIGDLLRGIPEHHAAKALIDNACWDLRAALSGQPLWRLLGGTRTVPMSLTLTRAAPAVMAAQAETSVARHGFRTLKVKGGQGLEVDRAALRAVRAAVGESVRLYIDANWAYGPDEGVRYVEAMAEAGATMVEDPWRLLPDARFAAAQRAASVPILVDFPCAGVQDAAGFLQAGARALSVKPARVGISACDAVTALAREAGAAVVCGLFGESDFGTLASAAFAGARAAAPLPCESTFFLAIADRILAAPLEIRDGALTLPAEAGASHVVRPERLRALAAA